MFGKPLNRAIWNTLGLHAVLTTCLIFSSVLDSACVACCLLLSTGSHHVRIQIHATGCCISRCTTETFGSQKSTLWWCKLGAGYSCPSKAGKPRTASSQQPACEHEEHQILSTSEATAFAAQFWDKKTHPTKASQHEFLATCIDVDLEQNVTHAGRQKYTRKNPIRNNESSLEHCLCPVRCPVYSSGLKIVTTYPPPPQPIHF